MMINETNFWWDLLFSCVVNEVLKRFHFVVYHSYAMFLFLLAQFVLTTFYMKCFAILFSASLKVTNQPAKVDVILLL